MRRILKMSNKQHWGEVYSKRKSTEVTWHQPEPRISLELIRELELLETASIIDIGEGASTLVDYLIKDGFLDISVFDLSSKAMSYSQERLKEDKSKVDWIEGDITEFSFDRKFNLWHDRAVFHFLVDSVDQDNYLKILNSSLKESGYLIISTFAEDGPLKCSGLEIVRYSKDEMIKRVGKNFKCIKFEKETHISPGGMEQKFNYWVFQKS